MRPNNPVSVCGNAPSARMEVVMGFVVLAGLGALAVLLFYKFAVYVVPAWAGLAAFVWAIGTGAGLGSVVVGLVVGVAVFVLGHLGLHSDRLGLRLLVFVVYVLSAAITGYAMLVQIGEGLVPSPIWCQLFAVGAGIMTGAGAYKSLLGPVPVGRKSTGIS